MRRGRTVHFQNISGAGNLRPLCQRAGVVCSWANSSALRQEVTCKLCLKLLMNVKREAA
jgi:hypothetical protein